MAANSDQTGYFSSYEDLKVHELMLKDEPRNLAYKNFIEQNANLFVNRTVLDVGAGTGILSLFAARAGAKKVYAVEASQTALLCRAIVDQNDYSHVITVIQSTVEDVELDEKVDIIVSEWMGFYLLHESMLNSVIVARDKWLKADGMMVPSAASIYVCPVTMKECVKDRQSFWKNVHGFDFSPALEAISNSGQPTISTLKPNQCLSEPLLLSSFDLSFVTEEDIVKIMGNLKFKLTSHGILHGFACWFDVEFEGDSPVELSTGPWSEKTHWQQTVMFLPDPLMADKGSELVCQLILAQDRENKRRYDITLALEDDDSSEEDGDHLELHRSDFTDNIIEALENKLNNS